MQLSFIISAFFSRNSLILFLLFIGFNLSTFASPATFSEHLKFKHITAADGLSQNNVFDIIQDNDGFIWVGTENGLNKYDGNEFTHYRKNIRDKNSISGNFIRKLFKDNLGTLWIGTEAGLSRYNKELDNFENYYSLKKENDTLFDNIIWDIYQDNKNTIWISTTKGIQKFNPENNNFTRIKVRGVEDKLLEIKTIFQDELGYYWFGTFDKGIYVVDDEFTYAFKLNEKNKWNLNIKVQSLFDMKEIDDSYWLATKNGIIVIGKDYKIKKEYLNNLSSNEKSNKIRTIIPYNKAITLAMSEDGLHLINIVDDKVNTIKSNKKNDSLSLNYLMGGLKDKQGNIWISTYGKGINILDPNSLIFQNFDKTDDLNMVDAFAELPNGDIWFISQQSILKKVTNDSSLDEYPLSEFDIFQIAAKNNDEILLFSTSGKLSLFDINKKRTQQITEWKQISNFNTDTFIQLQNNNIWFVDSNGYLASFNLNNQKVTRNELPASEKSAIIKYDHQDNVIWTISTQGKLYKFNLLNSTFELIKDINDLNYSYTSSISVGIGNNQLWLGSEQGILILNKSNNLSVILDQNSDLLNEAIYSIIIDNQQNGWAIKNSKLIYIDGKNLKTRTFGKDYGLSNTEFITGANLYTADGKILIGSMNGYYKYTPNELLETKQSINEPVFKTLLISNKKINISNDLSSTFSLNKTINSLTNLTLNYDQFPFSFEFTSPNPKLISQLKYKYKLHGNDSNWLETDNFNIATYSNLNPGKYRFELQAYDRFDPSIVKSKSINIQILPPWWLSNSAVLIYTLIGFLVLAYLLQQFRHKRLYHLQIKASEERLKLSLWGSGDEMWDWNIKRGKIYRSNIWGILEFPQDGKRNLGNDGDNETNINQDDIARITDALQEHFDDKTEHFEATYRVKDKDDKWIWVLDRGKIVERDDNNQPTRMTGTLKDISQIKKADERLKLFAKCIENISDAVVIYDRKFNIVDVNKSFQRITGKVKQQMIGKQMGFTRYPENFTRDVKKHLLNKGGWHGEIESKRDNGELYLTDLNIDIIRDENKSISHFVGVFSDITKRKETEAELRKLANSDTLTGLPNRSYFQANQARLVNNKIPHALLVFDLDNFKKVNDSMGHEVGDLLLCKVANRIKTVGRKVDTVYRLGGDEFSILIEDTNDIHTITTIAKNILQTIAQPLKLKNQEIVLYSSIGIVLYPEDGTSPQELLKNADTAMYHAKHTGGNQYQFFNGSMNKKAVKRLQIEGLIRHGLKEDFFSVFYQPKIEISTGKVAGMEALVRFETPSKGIISPVVFIPVSEETGQIIDIGETVLRKSCFATKEWIDGGLFDGRIAVNLSAVQFTQPNLVGMIESILKESQLPAKHLELEITEGTVMDSPQKAIETMLQIRAMGIHLSLDDFGTGYSSLAYLKKFPLNTLKIDKAFVDDIETSEQGRNMVATIVTIAHNLGLQVVAEGVETNQQLSFLSGLRCEQMQGYLYSKPLPQKDFRSYLLSHQITDKSTSFN